MQFSNENERPPFPGFRLALRWQDPVCTGADGLELRLDPIDISVNNAGMARGARPR